MDAFTNWNYPTDVRVGAGRAKEIADLCGEFGIRAPLLVTDPGLADKPMAAELVQRCRDHNLRIAVFSDLTGNPRGMQVRAGIAAFVRGRHDGVIALGGGSSLDAGKAIAVLARQQCDLWDLEDRGDNWRKADAAAIRPVIALPTTAGTGAEVGRAALIIHEQQQRKVILFHPKMTPVCAVLDPELTIGLPPHLTAATGMDALSHNLEAYCAPGFHPIAAGIAVEGIRLIRNNLPAATANGADRAARMHMLAASAMGAAAFQRGLGAMHALAHPLGAIYDAHHGLLNAILMPYVLRANRAKIESRIVALARYLELPPNFDGFLRWILDLRAQLCIPNDLAQLGVAADRAREIGEQAACDPSAATNPIQFTAEQYAEILRRACDGQVV